MTAYNEYGNALVMLAKDEDSIESVLSDSKIAAAILEDNSEYIKLLDTPAVSNEEKIRLIDEAFGTLGYSVINLLKILAQKKAVYKFREVFAAFFKAYDEEMGIERVEAVTAVPMSEEQIKKMSDKLAAVTCKKIIIKNTVSPEILGGVKLRYSGIQLDGSVKSRLDAFAENLKNIVV